MARHLFRKVGAGDWEDLGAKPLDEFPFRLSGPVEGSTDVLARVRMGTGVTYEVREIESPNEVEQGKDGNRSPKDS